MGYRHFFLLFICVICSVVSIAQVHWESIIIESDPFKYIIPDFETSPAWFHPGYDDDDWLSAPGGFGYGDADDGTKTDTGINSLFLRKEIILPASVPVYQLVLDVDYDDAFVAYLNGEEIARSANLQAGRPALAGSVTEPHEAEMYTGGLPERFILDPQLLLEGSNVFSFHVLNYSSSSSDMSSRIFVHAKLASSSVIYHNVPSWFEEVISYEASNLPILKIDTDGSAIPDEPKIMAEMQIIHNADGINHFDDTDYEYDGHIGIEVRGNSSQRFPKKSYSIETRLSTGENNNVSLLGLPEENDWVLHGPYSDKSLMRNALAYYIGNAMENGWHPGTRFVEVELNREYRGVYLLVEKIKIDKHRVDIADLKPEDISGNELSGGYIISIDRDQTGSWISPFLGRTGHVDVPFSYVDPGYEELLPVQRDYIRNYITDFEYALHGQDYLDPELGYRNYIHILSFIDYFIITELSKDLDGYRVSVYFHKDKDSKNGRLTMTPYWDYNICFGNADFFDAFNTTGWASDGIGIGDWYEIPFWWDKFRTDPYFETLLRMRWFELREDVLSEDRIGNFIDSVSTYLADAQTRNFEKFDILNTYVWPNYYIGGSYENEVEYLKDWIGSRINWLDQQFLDIDPLELDLPEVGTLYATSIKMDSALLAGEVISDGGSYVWKRGLYVGRDPDLLKEGEKIEVGRGSGVFSYQLSDLKAGTLYYYMAYAENDLGTTYSNISSFSTLKGTSVKNLYLGETGVRIRAYPNPFTERVFINLDLGGEAVVEIILTNINGQVVYSRSENYKAGRNQLVIEETELPAGMNVYFYTVIINNRITGRGKILQNPD